MKLAALVLLISLVIVFLAFQNVSLFFIGYLWASVINPAAFTQGYLSAIPMTFIFGVLCLLSYVAVNKENKAKYPAVFYLAIAFALWVTFTTFLAVLQDVAWAKWQWAIQSIIISIAMPLFLRTRPQIEAGFIAVLSALSAHVMTAGVKTMLGSGGYDRLGRLMMTNNWLGETSTLALAAVMTIPMAWYAAKHSSLFSPYRGTRVSILFFAYTFIAVMCLIGTSARTGLIAFATFLVFGIKGVMRKVLVISAIFVAYVFASGLLPERSLERFSTLQNVHSDNSAETRIAVWKWAADYSSQHPLGGGFGIFNTSVIRYMMPDSGGRLSNVSQFGRAAHSVYFEVLGEHGYIGLVLFLGILGFSAIGCIRIQRKYQNDVDDGWCSHFARSLFTCIIVFCAGGSFIGIAFQPLIYCFVGLYIALYRIAYRQYSLPFRLGTSSAREYEANSAEAIHQNFR